MYETLQLNTMTRQPKIIQILCRGLLSMLLYLEKYLTQAMQVTYFEILKILIFASSNTVSCTVLQVENSLVTTHH